MRRLGKYRDLVEVGRGASATVYRGMHGQLKVVRALKVFEPEQPEEGHRVKEAFYQCRVEHPGIVRVIDLEREPDSGLFYLVMEYAPQGDLRRRLADGPLEAGLALELGRQMAEALAAAHQQGVWHLDLKPDNVLFFESDRVKLSDFGLARSATDPLDPAWVVGTPNYMAPEQLAGRPQAASDLWSLGAMLLEMLTGRMCFPGESLSQVQAALAAGPVRVAEGLAQAGVSLPLEQVDLLQALLAEDPGDRPGSAREVARLLKKPAPARMDSGQPGPTTLRISLACRQCGAKVPLGQDLCPDCQAEQAGPPEEAALPALPVLASPPSGPFLDIPPKAAGGPWRRRWVMLLSAALGLALAAGLALSGPGEEPMPLAGPELPQALPSWPGDERQGGPVSAPAQPTPTLAANESGEVAEKPPAKSPAPQAKPAPEPKHVIKAKPATRTAKKESPPPAPAASRPKPIRAKRPARSKEPKAPTARAAKANAPRAAVAKPPSAPKRTDEIIQTKGKQPKAAIIPKAARSGASLATAPRPGRTRPAKPTSEPPRGYGEAELCKLLASQPDHLGARRNLALLYWQQGRNREAVMQLQAILRAHPHDREAHQTLQMIISQTRGKETPAQ